MKSRPRIEVDLEELDATIDRATQAPLSEPEAQKLKAAVHAMAERLLRNRPTEKTNKVLPADSSPAEETGAGPSAAAGHGRRPVSAFTGAQRVPLAHATLQPGGRCPECGRGKVYPQEPVALVRFVGRPPLEATIFEKQRLRCNACQQIFTAGEPVAAGETKYDVAAVAMIALLKYGTGVPFKRLERLEGQLGMPLAAATQWELVAAAAQLLRAVWEELIRQAAQGGVMHNDDTGMRILRLVREPGDKRTGTFTSGIVSMIAGWKIALFFTGAKHAGENLAEVLKKRARELAPPVQMCDALTRNTPKLDGIKTLLANCLAHGRRQFVEVAENFPQECRYVLETLRGVYYNDALAREQNLSAEERLHFHREHSAPLMQALYEWMEAQFAEHKTEPNSGLGKAISYLLNHWPKLTLFLEQPGTPLDNNIVERALKKAILNRKNALFYKTMNGAGVGDLFMSLIHTCELNSANPLHYLTELLRHPGELKQKPPEWMPWNYQDTLARLATPAAA
ncbi:MAG: IS66 family transposase [Bryobacteraceae bacterium]